MVARGLPRPVLVGGAAVELYSRSAVATGDFDIVSPWQEAFEEELQRVGFVRPSGAGVATRGWVHSDLALGFEVVSGRLHDGLAEHERIVTVDLSPDGVAAFVSLEDIIADRMGQYISGTASEMLGQARGLFAMYPDADLAYMEARTRYETGGDYGVEDLKG